MYTYNSCTNHGIICPQIPTGSCRVYVKIPGSEGSVSPVILSAHPASRKI